MIILPQPLSVLTPEGGAFSSQPLNFLAQVLFPMDGGIAAVQDQEFIMGSLLFYAPFLKDYDLVAITQRG